MSFQLKHFCNQKPYLKNNVFLKNLNIFIIYDKKVNCSPNKPNNNSKAHIDS